RGAALAAPSRARQHLSLGRPDGSTSSLAAPTTRCGIGHGPARAGPNGRAWVALWAPVLMRLLAGLAGWTCSQLVRTYASGGARTPARGRRGRDWGGSGHRILERHVLLLL